MTRRRPGGAGRCRAVVFLNGDYIAEAFDRRLAACSDLLLAADGGAARLDALGLRPAIVVGDCDSLDPAVALRLEEDGVPFVRHPVRKDRTDTELAVDEALARGATEIVLAGAARGALDHVLGHVAVLRRLAGDGVEGSLADPALWATVVTGFSVLRLEGVQGQRVSLAALTREATVTLRGFDYGLDRGVLRADSCLGLGNKAAERRQLVCVHTGVVLALVLTDALRLRARRRVFPFS